jgi:hypothetical protein
MPVALDVVGQVLVEMGGDSAQIEAQGDRIIVRLPSLRVGTSYLRRFARGAGGPEAIRRVHQGLVGAGLTLEVIVGNATVGVLGAGARSGLASRLLGLGPMEVRVGGLLGSFRKPVHRPE